MAESVPADPSTEPSGPVSVAVYESWVRDHLQPVHRYLRRRARPDDVDDLTAEVFAIAWRRRDDVPAEAVLPWLYRTSHFVLANHRRARRDLAVGSPTDVADLAHADLGRSGLDVDDVADVAIEDAALAAAWATLGPRDRQILMLSAWEGLNGTELAAALDITPGGAGAALHRARQRLAEALARAEGESTAAESTAPESMGAGETQDMR